MSQHEDGIRFGVFEPLLKIRSRLGQKESGDQTTTTAAASLASQQRQLPRAEFDQSLPSALSASAPCCNAVDGAPPVRHRGIPYSALRLDTLSLRSLLVALDDLSVYQCREERDWRSAISSGSRNCLCRHAIAPLFMFLSRSFMPHASSPSVSSFPSSSLPDG